MEDKDFLGYFSKLGPPSSQQEIKNSANKIVNTLVAISTVSNRKGSMDSTSKALEVAEAALKQKYMTGDLGEKVSADLNYALKRLSRGLCSENHGVKQGFFLASVLVLNRFKSSIDFEKYLKHMFSETKVNQTMKSAETNNASLGRMMCLSALIEAKVFYTSPSQINQRTLKVIVGCLVELYTKYDFLQESISAVFSKLLTILKEQKQYGLQALEIIVDALIVNKGSKGEKEPEKSGSFDFRANILNDSNRLSLYLRMKEVYHSSYSGLSKEYEEIFAYKVLADKKNLKLIQNLISRQTFLYPRIHSSLPLLLNEIANEPKSSDQIKISQSFFKSIIEAHLFNDDVYQAMKSSGKFKFLYIGLNYWKLAVESIQKWDVKLKAREQLLDSIVGPNFLRVLVKNVSNTKNQLHESAT